MIDSATVYARYLLRQNTPLLYFWKKKMRSFDTFYWNMIVELEQLFCYLDYVVESRTWQYQMDRLKSIDDLTIDRSNFLWKNDLEYLQVATRMMVYIFVVTYVFYLFSAFFLVLVRKYIFWNIICNLGFMNFRYFIQYLWKFLFNQKIHWEWLESRAESEFSIELLTLWEMLILAKMLMRYFSINWFE